MESDQGVMDDVLGPGLVAEQERLETDHRHPRHGIQLLDRVVRAVVAHGHQPHAVNTHRSDRRLTWLGSLL